MHPTYYVVWRACRTACQVLFRCRIYHPERVPSTGPVILAANHASLIDPPLVGLGLKREIHYLARESLFRLPILGFLLPRINVVPVDREGGGAAGLRAIFDRLLAGGGILLFPEGTRTPDGRFQHARSGIGLTVIKSTAPVVPVRVFGTFDAWGRGRRWPSLRRVAVKYGQPLDFAALREEARHCSKARLKAIYQQSADEIMAAIARLEPCWDRTSFP